MLDNLVGRRSRADDAEAGAMVVPAVPEGEFNMGAAEDGEAGALRIEDLMNASDLSKVERKRLAKVARGESVRRSSLPRLCKPSLALSCQLG